VRTPSRDVGGLCSQGRAKSIEMQKAPMAGRGFSLLLLLDLELLAAGDGFVMPAADSSLALGALSMHRSGLEAALLQPAHDLVLGEADIRFDLYIWNPSALHVSINRLAVNLQHRFEVFGRLHIGQSLEACEYWLAMVHHVTP
jgi:hypothetical protein